MQQKLVVLSDKQDRAPDAELTRDLDRVARGPVLDDPAVLEAADDDAAQRHCAAAICACQRPPRGHAVALAHLVVDDEAQVGKDLEVERDRPARPFVAAVLERVDVVDELRVVDGGNVRQVLPGADLFEGPPGRGGAVCGGGLGGHEMGVTGLEPVTSALSRRRSPN
jgi:hypothetical protein